jgi:ribosomal protein S18 acetylase RimI-like enzyme
MNVARGSVSDAFEAYRRIPEFAPHSMPDRAEFERRLACDSALVLVAVAESGCIGFKVGYDRYRDGSFYSWLGGVLPEFRGRGVAEALLTLQETLAGEAGYRRIYVKTRNRFAAMRALLARAHYAIVSVDSRSVGNAIDDLRLTLVKAL